MSEQSFVTKAADISIRHTNYSAEVRLEFNRRISEINKENLITPKWLDRKNRGKALEILNSVESLLGELLELYKTQTLSMFKELASIDEDISPDRKMEFLANYMKKLNASSYQVGGFFALIKTHLELSRELFNFFEERDEFIYIESDEFVFVLDEDIDTFNQKIEEMTLIFNQLQNFASINEENMKKLAESVGIVVNS